MGIEVEKDRIKKIMKFTFRVSDPLNSSRIKRATFYQGYNILSSIMNMRS